jgi:hypothetical protein
MFTFFHTNTCLYISHFAYCYSVGILSICIWYVATRKIWQTLSILNHRTARLYFFLLRGIQMRANVYTTPGQLEPPASLFGLDSFLRASANRNDPFSDIFSLEGVLLKFPSFRARLNHARHGGQCYYFWNILSNKLAKMYIEQYASRKYCYFKSKMDINIGFQENRRKQWSWTHWQVEGTVCTRLYFDQKVLPKVSS